MKKICYLFLLIITLSFIGCVKDEPKSSLVSDLLKDPSVYTVHNLSVSGKEINLSDEQYQAIVPSLSSIYDNQIKIASSNDKLPIVLTLGQNIKLSFSDDFSKCMLSIGVVVYDVVSEDGFSAFSELKYYGLSDIEKVIFDYNSKLKESENCNVSDLTATVFQTFDNGSLYLINTHTPIDVVKEDSMEKVVFKCNEEYSLYFYDSNRNISHISSIIDMIDCGQLRTIRDTFYLQLNEAKLEGVSKVYGVYQNIDNYAIVVNSSVETSTEVVDGKVFVYEDNQGVSCLVNGNFISLTDAFNNGYLSSSDISSIYLQYGNHTLTYADINSGYSLINPGSITSIVIDYNSREQFNSSRILTDSQSITSFYNALKNAELTLTEEEGVVDQKLYIYCGDVCYKYRYSSIINYNGKAYSLDFNDEDYDFSSCYSFNVKEEVTVANKKIDLSKYYFKQTSVSSFDLSENATFDYNDSKVQIYSANQFYYNGKFYNLVSGDFSILEEAYTSNKAKLEILNNGKIEVTLYFSIGQTVDLNEVITILKQNGINYSLRVFYADSSSTTKISYFTIEKNTQIFLGPIELPWV